MSVTIVRFFVDKILGDVMPTRYRTTLTELSAGLLGAGTLTLGSVGRAMEGTPKHNIKKGYRFCTNSHVSVMKTMCAFARILLTGKKWLVLSTDWTVIGSYPVLATCVVGSHCRGLPILFHARGPRACQAKTEYRHFRALRRLLPDVGLQVILGDRGFGNARTVETLAQAGLSSVLRLHGKTHVRLPGEFGWVSSLRLSAPVGKVVDHGWAEVCKVTSYRARLIYCHAKGQKEPWLLVTDLTCSAEEVVQLYARRFTVEELFRDFKDAKTGMGLGHFGKMKNARRLERLLLIATTANLVQVSVGAYAEQRGWHRLCQVNTRDARELSLPTLGRTILSNPQFAGKLRKGVLFACARKLPLTYKGLDAHPLVGLERGLRYRILPPIAGRRTVNRAPRPPRPGERELAARIASLVKDKGLAYAYLVKPLRVSVSSLSMAITGARGFSPGWIPHIARLLGLSTAELIRGTGYKMPRKRRKAAA